MDTEIVRSELERLFELEELTGLCREVLGFDPEEVGGGQAKGSFALALTRHCERHDALEALCDAIWVSRPDASPAIGQIRFGEVPEEPELGAGERLGPFSISERLGEGRMGVVYRARRDDDSTEYRLKVLRTEAARDARSLQRFLALTRLAAQIDHPGLPAKLNAGEVAGRFYVAHRCPEGQTLGTRIERVGPVSVAEARPLVTKLLEALAALHDRRLAHGDLRLENVVIDGWQESLDLTLLDAASDRLRPRPRPSSSRVELYSTSGSPATVSPEQIQGMVASPASDVYSFGALIYQMLSGKPVFGGSALDAAFGHLRSEPVRPSSQAPEGWIDAELDALILTLLRKDPAERPKDARRILELVEAYYDKARRRSIVPPDESIFGSKLEAFLSEPENTERALELEGLVAEGAPLERVARAFLDAADRVETGKAALLFRAARLFDKDSERSANAESTYRAILALSEKDEVAAQGLERALTRAGKFEELVELLLERTEKAESALERARSMAEIGRVYLDELGDREQAVVAYAQAFVEEPRAVERRAALERVAKGDEQTWVEILQTLGAAAEELDESDENRLHLYENMGKWYVSVLSRPDLALPCFQAVLAKEPANDAALLGLCEIYRSAQQWRELGMTLTTRANAAPAPLARELRSEAADILQHQLNDTGGARDIYEQVVAEDPGHDKAVMALGQIYERDQEFSALARLLEGRIAASGGQAAPKLHCQLADVYDTRLNDAEQATRHYQAALEQDPDNLDALRGLDAIFSKAGKFEPLLSNLKRQIELAATPRQKIGLWERVAGIYAEEFLDHANAAKALEEVLAVDEARLSALSELMPHYRALDRWEDVSSLYDRQLKLTTDAQDRVELGLAWGRVLAEQLGAVDRATRAYEGVLEDEPEHPRALEALAKLRESSGDADAALDAILALADKAASPEARAEQHVRAAKLLESRGNQDRAIEQYKFALDANPADKGVNIALRGAYLARGEVNAAMTLLEKELSATEGERAKAKLAGEMARLARQRLKDNRRAEEAAQLALSFDPTNLDALVVLGDIAFESGHLLQAASHYGSVAERTDTLDKAEAVRILVRYVDSLSQSGSTEKALAPMDTLRRLAPEDMDAMERVALVTFEHGSAARSVDLYADLLERFGSKLPETAKALSHYRYGESLRRDGQLEKALRPLEEAADLDPSLAEPLTALAEAHLALGDHKAAIKAKTRLLDVASPDERVELLISIGDLAHEKLGDRTQAAKSYVAALDEKPNDRRLLTKLMQLYSDEKDWNKLIEVVLKLAEFVDEPAQKAKYLQTAGMLSARQVGDVERALSYYEQALSLQPSLTTLDEVIGLERDRGKHEQVEAFLKQKLDIVTLEERQDEMLKTFVELGTLYEKDLGDLESAIDAYEAAQTLEQDPTRGERLMDLYASDLEKYLDRAIALQMTLLEKDPFQHDSYKRLRRVYTEAKQADASWCLCQTLAVLNLAEPDEERFYNRMRADTAAPAQEAINDDDWLRVVMHPYADPLLTSVCALIEPAVLSARGADTASLGYREEHQVDLQSHYATLAQNLFFATGVIGMDLPPCYENVNDPGGLSFLNSYNPSIVMGNAALQADIPPQAAAFIAARHISYLRPGMFLRQLIGSGTVLKSWIFAAIKLTAPQFPVAAELEGPVNEALESLKRSVTGEARDQLTRAVSKLLQSGASLDLKRWIAGVDLTADRAGFIVGHDLRTAAEIINASDDAASAATKQDRFKELVIFSVSPGYFDLRQRLGIGIDS